ncbi:DUF2180 family protein [Cellulomonas carbonis]|uniref:DUF2180 family protein n=1 Tax=Cellulomonas carbonis TaxID=1386092 RepID=UPI0009DEEB61
MNCFDCSQDGTTTPAVGVCSHCGAALCTGHVTACSKEVRHENGLGSPTVADPAGRALCCTTCRDAGTGRTRLAS